MSLMDKQNGETKMATKKPANAGKHWTGEDISKLRQLARENTPTRVMGLKLNRTAEAVRGKANDIGLSLKPTNQSPYNRRKS
jgi:hypothetical protein